MQTTNLDIKKATTILAKAWNNLDVSIIEPYLADDINYSSQNVLTDMTTKKEVVEYLTAKMETIRNSPGAKVYAELGETRPYPAAPNSPEVCLVLAQGDKTNVQALALLEVESGKIKSIALCTVAPVPECAWRSGEYPH